MTYSYYLRCWAMERMNENLLGRDSIALACGVAPRTISTWYRAETGIGPYLLTTNREGDRAIAILLYERFPNQIDQVARICRTSPRAIREWRMQVRSPRFQSELIWATRLALTTLHHRIDDYCEIQEGQVILRKGYLPDYQSLQEMIFCVYDNILMHILSQTLALHAKHIVDKMDGVSSKLDMKPIGPPPDSHIPHLKRPLGPNRNRGSRMHKDGFVDKDERVLQRVRHFGHEAPSIGSLYRHYKNQTSMKGNLGDLLEYLESPEVENVQYKTEFGGQQTRWSEHHALNMYLWRVHPMFSESRRE